jgi:putative hydrolase of the HAD superfamily
MVRTIFFDFGNVLAFFDHQRATEKLARYTDLSPAELLLTIYGGVAEDEYERGNITSAEFIRESKLNGRLSCSDEVFREHFVDIFWPNPEVCDLIPRLRPHHRLVLASNTNEMHFEKYTAQFADVLKHFEHVVASHHARARKPHPEFFTYAHRFADTEAGACAFVDDLAVNTEKAAAFGWQTVTYRPDGTLADRLRALGVRIGTT